MTIETEDALRAALHRARSWIATDPAVDDDPYSILIEVDCALSLPSSGDQRDAVIEVAEAAEALSEAMVEAEAFGADFDRVDVPWINLTAAIQKWRHPSLKSTPADKEKV